MCGEVLQPPARARFLDHVSAAPCLFRSLQPCRQLVVEKRKGALVFVEYGIRIPLGFLSAAMNKTAD